MAERDVDRETINSLIVEKVKNALEHHETRETNQNVILMSVLTELVGETGMAVVRDYKKVAYDAMLVRGRNRSLIFELSNVKSKIEYYEQQVRDRLDMEENVKINTWAIKSWSFINYL